MEEEHIQDMLEQAVYQQLFCTDEKDRIMGKNPEYTMQFTGIKKLLDKFLKDLRENPPPDKWQPVIIISGQNELESIKKGFSYEADHYITKPCSMSDVLKAIRIMISLIPQRRLKTQTETEDQQRK